MTCRCTPSTECLNCATTRRAAQYERNRDHREAIARGKRRMAANEAVRTGRAG